VGVGEVTDLPEEGIICHCETCEAGRGNPAKGWYLK
jgi:hypothetical protein